MYKLRRCENTGERTEGIKVTKGLKTGETRMRGIFLCEEE
jgi:hypothetical protein